MAREKGMTLIEIMVVLAILAIVAGFAVPAYNGYIETAKRGECQNEVAAIKLAEEEFFLENNTYFNGVGLAALAVNSDGYFNPSTPLAVKPAANWNCNFQVTSGSTGALTSSYRIEAIGINDLAGLGIVASAEN